MAITLYDPGATASITKANGDVVGWPPKIIRDNPRRAKIWGLLAATSAIAGAYYGAKRNDNVIGGVVGAFVSATLPVVGPLWFRQRSR